MIDGIINVYKEAGFTSHDVVAKLRGILHQKKIGHTGTLDPDAQGVLPVCLGSATKVCDLITDWTKEYRAVLLLGKDTDTQDVSGTVLNEQDVSCSEEEARAAVLSFLGEQEQIPPMYSALKVNGKKLYELARQGIEVERKARHIKIEKIEIHRIELPEVEFSVCCSKGTYIRTLCHDIGEKLGCGGCMKSLLRTRVGIFPVGESVRLDEIADCQSEDRVGQVVMAVDSVFSDLPRIHLSEETERLVKNGNPIYARLIVPEMVFGMPDGVSAADLPAAADGMEFRVYDQQGKFLAVYEWDHGKHMYRARKMFL